MREVMVCASLEPFRLMRSTSGNGQSGDPPFLNADDSYLLNRTTTLAWMSFAKSNDQAPKAFKKIICASAAERVVSGISGVGGRKSTSVFCLAD
jgi:hypothetical protein